MTRTTNAAVAALVRETLALDGATDIADDTLLFYDLEFTSMDLLDLLFRLEEHFEIEIPEGTLYGLARGELDDDAFCANSVLTAVGRARLMALLHDTPPQVFGPDIHAQTLPRYCTVGAFARLVDHKLQEKCSS